MPKNGISIDEYLNKRSLSAHDGVVYRAAKMPKSFNAETRSATFIMTDETVDSYGDIVRAKGADLTRFESNPICLLNHKADLVLGTWSDVKRIVRRIEGTATLADAGTAPHVDMAYNLMSQGILKACSIGFMPKEIEMRLDEDGNPTWSYDILAWEMYECSVVSIPANPSALAKSMKEGCTLSRDFLEEVLDTYVKTPAGLIVSIADIEKSYKDGSGDKTSAVIKKDNERKEDELVPAPSFEMNENEIAEYHRLMSGLMEKGRITEKTKELCEKIAMSLHGELEQKDASDDDPDANDPDDGNDIMNEEKAKKDASWACKASNDLPIDEDSDWDGAGAKSRMLEAAGIGGDSPDHAKAAKGFLAVDTANPDLKGSYKLPFADIKGGELKALASGVRAAASRLPQTDIPDDVQKSARNVLDAYESKMDSDDKKSLGSSAVVSENIKEGLVVAIDVNTDAATEKLNAFSKLIDTVATRLNKLFGSKDIIVEPEPVAPPTPEEFEAAKAKAAAIRERLATKGLIEA